MCSYGARRVAWTRALRRGLPPAPRHRPGRDGRVAGLLRRRRRDPRPHPGPLPPHEAARAGPDACRSTSRPPSRRRTSTPSRPTRSRGSPATSTSSGASGPTSAGTPRSWWYGPTCAPTASAATSPPTPARPPSTRSASTTSSGARTTVAPATRSTSRATPRPGIYARAFVEGRLSEAQLDNFRHEVGGNGLPSYPHPRLLPDFWEYPTVSMGLGPDQRHLPGPRQPLPAPPPAGRHQRQSGVVLRRRRGDGRARVDRRPGGRRPRAPRQPDLRGQLQPPAPRRPGPGEREDHPGARGRLPRRRVERHQGHLGLALGRAAGPRRRRRAAEQDEHHRRRRVPEVRHRVRGLHPRALLRPRPPAAQAGRAPDRRRAADPAPGRARLPQALRRLQAGHRAAGRADRDPGQDHQGLDPGARDRGPQRHPPDQEDDQGAAPRPAGPALPGRRDPRRGAGGARAALLPATGGLGRPRVPDGPPEDPGRLAPPAGGPPGPGDAARSQGLRRSHRRFGQAGGLDHHGLRPAAAQPGARPRLRPAGGADRLRRGPHLRPGAHHRRGRRSTPPKDSATSRSTPTCPSSTPRASPASSCRRASPRPAVSPPSPPWPRPTPPGAIRCCRSSSSIRCSASSGWAT